MAKPRNVKIKICGMTRVEDALKAAEFGADAVGFIFYKKSPRAVTDKMVREMVSALPPFVQRVGVFVNEKAERINALVSRLGLDIVQLHGDETPAFCRKIEVRVVKAVRMQDPSVLERLADYPVDGFLLDTFHPGAYGGTGEVFDWRLAKKGKRLGPVILAGGLNPDNVSAAIRQVGPYGVDVCSGVEKKPGVKDFKKMRAFVSAVRQVDQE